MEAVARASGSIPVTDEQRAQHEPLVLFPLKRQRKPERWQFIKLISLDEFKDKPVHEFNSSMAKGAYCTECKLSIQYKSGQNNSVRLHMERMHSETMSSSIKTKQPRQGRALHLDVRSSEEASTQTKGVTVEEQRKADCLLVIWVAKGMRPISIVDDPAFRAHVTFITRDLGGTDIKVPGRTELTHGIALLANEFRAKLMREMANGCDHYCCTTDIWTDRAQRSFICLTLHNIDARFEHNNWTLEVKPLPGQHTGEAIAEALRDTLSEWGLKTDKCVALLRDGASNGVSAGNQLGVPHFSCVSHSLHLVLASGLIRKRSRTSLPVDINAEDEDDASTIAVLQDSACDEVEHQLNQLASPDERTTTDRIRSIVQMFRSMASYFHRSPKAKYRLSKLQAENELDMLEVVMDCPTRWNSCRDMLVRFVRIEASINLFFVHLESMSGRREFPDAWLSRPKPDEWSTIKCLTSLLDPIWGATELLSGEGYPTLGLALPCLRTIQSSLDNAAIFDDVMVLANNQSFVDETLGLMQNMRKTLSELFRVRFARSAFATDLKWVSFLDPRLTEIAHLDP